MIDIVGLKLLRGLEHLHERWVIHRDLKMSNLLYTNHVRTKKNTTKKSRTYPEIDLYTYFLTLKVGRTQLETIPPYIQPSMYLSIYFLNFSKISTCLTSDLFIFWFIYIQLWLIYAKSQRGWNVAGGGGLLHAAAIYL